MTIYKHDMLHNRNKYINPVQGDIRVTQHMDGAGRRNEAGNHTNYGYSGKVLVFVYDGERWAWLRNKDKPKLPSGFGVQYEARELVDDYVRHFSENSPTEFNFWWWKGKRFARIEGLEAKTLEIKKQKPRKKEIIKGVDVREDTDKGYYVGYLEGVGHISCPQPVGGQYKGKRRE